MARSSQNSLGLYGVMDADDALLAHTHGDMAGVTLVPFRDLVAVVLPAPYVRAPQTDEQLNEYLRILDAANAIGAVVPAPAGTVFRSEAVLTSWMEIHYAKLHEALGVIERQDRTMPPYDYVRMDLTA